MKLAQIKALVGQIGTFRKLITEAWAWEDEMQRASLLLGVPKAGERAQMRAAIRLSETHTESARSIYAKARAFGVNLCEVQDIEELVPLVLAQRFCQTAPQEQATDG